MSTLKNRVIGLAASLALLLLVVGIPALLVAIDAVPRISDFSGERLTNPDDGTMALSVIGAVAWLAWLMFASSAVVELVARVRGIRAPRLAGLAVPQMTAGRLIALAALLFVAVPTAARSVSTSQEAAATPLAESPETMPSTQHPGPIPNPGSEPALGPTEETPTTTYTVKRGDSLWKIAEQQLGDGRRYDEIVSLNEVVLHGQPDFITPGTLLRIPGAPEPDENEGYVVLPGDTLSEIAEKRLGDATAYRRIFDASRGTLQPNGDRLTDPDLIRPGWQLIIPGPDRRARDDPRKDPQAPAQEPDDRPTEEAPTPPTTESPTRATDDTRGTRAQYVDAPGTETPVWIMPGLAGAGAILAGSLLLVLRQHRRTQQRHRRPGRIIAPPPPELGPVEKTAHLVGTSTAPKIDLLDRALRHLAGACLEVPRLLFVELTDREVTLHLAHPADLPEPWQGAEATWALTLDSNLPDASGEVAPYPLLVSVGQRADGALVLVNLEELRSITVSGAPETTTALGRHIAAELVLNPWSTLVEIDTIGIGSELASIDPLRLHHHQADDSAFLDHLANELEGEPATEDPDRFRALLATADNGEIDVSQVAKIITGRPGRSAAAVVAVNGTPGSDDVELHVTAAGRLQAPALGPNLISAGLTADEAAACAAIVDLTRDVDDLPAPVAQTSNGEEEPLQDQAGALRIEMTEPRPAGAPGERSLLPLDAGSYEHETATTTEDVDKLAPLVSPSIEQEVSERDPDLDADLTAWSDPDSPLPKLILLGPVDARATGEAKPIAHRKPFYVELLAYLALHPSGVTSLEVCDAFGLTPNRARGDLTHVRRWLGTDPRTGAQHLPSARARQNDDHRGLAVYQLDGVLTDLDLFRRLRTRGQSRGSDGMSDLIAALHLVSGEPFTRLRPAGWSWLLDGDRIDHIITCAIVDVAHIVTTHALTAEDFELARFAAETAYHAAPDDETSRLDIIDVAAATGHADLAERHLIEGIFNRSDDNLGPIDLPRRTASIVKKRGWDPAKYRGAS
jgi:nucleoid-associated protein YgaU